MTATQSLAILAVAILLAGPLLGQTTGNTPASSTESSPRPWSLFLERLWVHCAPRPILCVAYICGGSWTGSLWSALQLRR